MRKFNITVNGQTYEVEVEEAGGAPSVAAPAPAPAAPVPAAPAPAAPKPAAPAAPVNGVKIESPMPGTILTVNAKVGQSVKSGDTLMVLEAMKMENEILAPQDGTVKAVQVSQGATVQTGDLLVVIE